MGYWVYSIICAGAKWFRQVQHRKRASSDSDIPSTGPSDILPEIPCRICRQLFLSKPGLAIHYREKHPQAAFHEFAYTGNVEQLRILMKSDPQYVNVIHPLTGLAPIHEAARQGHIVILQMLLETGAEINKQAERTQLTALHFAAAQGNMEMLNLLLSKGANVHIRSITGGTALHVAARFSRVAIIKALIVSGSDVLATTNEGNTSLHIAAMYASSEIVMALLEGKAEPNETRPADGATPLHCAVTSYVQSTDKIKALLEFGAIPNTRNSWGDTPLHLAVTLGCVDQIKLLVSTDAFVNVRRNDGNTPIHLAAWTDNLQILDILVSATSDSDILTVLNERNQYGETPLHIATRAGRADMCKAVIASGSKVNAFRSDGWAPIHLAWNLQVLQVLIDQGCDVELRSRRGSTALHIAVENHYYEGARKLLAAGANVDAFDGYGRTPLTIAMSMGDEVFVRILMEAGANSVLCDKFGNSPFSWISPQTVRDLRLLAILQSGPREEVGLDGKTKENVREVKAAVRSLARLYESDEKPEDNMMRQGSRKVHFEVMNDSNLK